MVRVTARCEEARQSDNKKLRIYQETSSYIISIIREPGSLVDDV